ncbi:hypothetical protein HYALB_00005742 [Hymenoscyphus albidus]|uniref:Carrier domain-containing protein n=1 Tax=Hymenoscyphus albidus TaxID=595503 RepID=A0A9N9Q1Q3_9HELO|nr:hypothetical protein HYALB_00005742 [Hymenoscyphus albidus]
MGNRYPNSFELELIRAVGKNLPAAVRGERQILEFMMHNNMLQRLYAEGTGVGEQTVFLGRMAKQLAHRYPQTNILEIGAGTGGATKSALKEMGEAFTSYTFTDISPGFFENAQQVFEEYSHRMTFKVLDIEKDIESQGFIPGSYDVIIASLVLHATKNIQVTLHNVRRLLKPGGFLLMCELTSPPPLRMGFIFSGLPGWWLGVDDDRTLSPCINPTQWDAVLRKTGFSGIESMTPEVDFMVRPGFVIASQAVDDRIVALRQPLASPPAVANIPKLIIIGGKESQVVDPVGDLLSPYCNQIHKFDTLEDIEENTVTPISAILILADLDVPTFQSITKRKLSGIKLLFDKARTVLWVTRGSRAAVPYSNIAVGFGRSLAEELPHVRLQFLDFDHTQAADPKVIAEFLLMGHLLDVWENMRVQGNMLWSKEPEISQHNGRMFVPRLIADKPRNDVYNSGRRLITKEVDPAQFPVQLYRSKASYSIKENLEADLSVDTIFLKVTHSLLSPIQVSRTSFLYLVLGTDVKTRKNVLAFSKVNASMVEVPSEWIADCNVPAGQEAQTLRFAGFHLIAQAVVPSDSPSTTFVIHEPEVGMTAILSKIAAERNLKIRFTTHMPENSNLPGPWIFIHPMSTNDDIKQSLPEDISVFLDMTALTHVRSIIEPCIPSWCRVISLASVFGENARVSGQDPSVRVSKFFAGLSEALIGNTNIPGAPAIRVEDVIKVSNLENLTVVDWTESSTLPVPLNPVDSRNLFASNKTYILFGMTSNLGQSLVTWMVQRGARHVVLTSRQPNVDSVWIRSLERIGASIKVFANDITEKISLQKLCREIRDQCPQVGGIANGAMVLHDTLIRDLDLETLVKVLKPKVDGSRYLDEIFHDDKLEFCVFFSSLAGIYGNRGQSNYSAANAFMAALAAQRRSRGQAASILHLGAIMGAGYVSREGSSSLLRSLDRAGWLWLSERDFHQSFAEAIVRGHSDFQDPHKCEVLVGARRVESEEGLERQWFDNPKFQHCANQHGSVAAKSNDSAATVSLKSRLLIVTTEKEAYEIIKDSFLVKLKVSLQLQDLSGDKQKAILSQGADQLGMDSLIAVEIRSWFLKEYLVDIQVLKVLGGATIGEILDLALEKLPQELTPNIRLSDPDKSNPSGRETPASESKVSATNSVTLSIEGKESISTAPTTSSASTTPVDELHFVRTEAMGFGQSRFWSMRNILEDQTTFNIVCSGSLSGPLRISQLEKAVSKVAQVHEVLRTAFFERKDYGYVQGILPQSRIQLEHQSITNEREISREHDAMRAHVFDLEHGDTFRFKVLSLTSTSHFLIIGYHHIVMDGMSLEFFLSDLAKVYGDQKLESPPQSYCDFSLEERENVTAGRMNPELAYWKDSFSDITPTLPLLPFSQTRCRQNLSKYNFVKSEVKIRAKLATKIKNVCKEQKVTPFHFYLAAFKSMLFRILDTEEICIGMADANRTNSTIISSLGMFMNLLPLRFRTDPSQEFKDALKEARMKAYSALTNGNVPFNVLLEILDVPRSASHSPLFQAFINYRQGVQEKRYIGDCEVEGLNYQIARSSYDISLDIIDNPGGDSTISFMLQESLYSQSVCERILDYFVNIVKGVSSNPSLTISLIPIFSASSIQEALALGRGPEIDSKWAITLGHQIDSIIKDRKSDIALRDEVGKMTFKDMSRRIDQISAALFSCNIQPQSIIGVLQEPTSDWICSLLAIWKLGHIYLPLDTQIPHARLNTMVLDCKPAAILFHATTLQIASSLTRENMKKLNISCLSDEPASPLTNRATPQSLAAIIYTSGSTGIPKGILLKHSSLVNQMEQYVTDLSISHQVVMQQSAFSFDLSLWEMLMGLTCGGSVYVVPNSKRRDPISITNLITEEGITLTLATPTEYLSWLKYGSSLKSSKLAYALSGGEALTPSVKQAFYKLSKSGLRLFNFYGPAESTISCHTAELDYTKPVSMTSSNPIPAGFTIRNTSTYILDENRKPLPVGFTGEVAIGGAAVAEGYFNNDELTARTFPENLHATSSDLLDKGWKKMLRTGDRGRLREDGALLLEGRISGDTQVKFMGVRIELQDIENTILQAAQPALSEAVVSFRAESNILVAHVVFSVEYPLEDRAGFLKRLLPSLPLAQYMRPVIIIPLESLPITAHSKIDRMLIQKLPIPQGQKSTLAHPLTDTEHQLKEVWESVLAKEVIEFNDFTSDTDFFHAGGNSGILVRVQALVRERFDVVIPLFDFFEASTLGAMASKIEKAVPEGSIDWDEETSVSSISSSSIAAEPLTKTSTSTGKMVLLTGATGFLGKKILETLINDAGISKVCCILRGENRIPFKSDKLMVYSGNLTAPLLGLHEDTFKALAQEVDIIIHSGAQRSFWEYYQLLRRANVSSTKELAKMAAARRIPIQYISSGGVLKFDNSASPSDGSDGYVASKWASEKILEKASKAFGIPITIHRTLATSQTSGSSSAILEQFLDLTRQMKVLPFATGWTGEMDLLPLDTVTTAICKMASQEQAAETGPRYIHHHAEVKLSASELSGYLESHIGEQEDFARMPGLEWIGKIKQLGFGYLISSQKMTLESDGKWARDPLISSA